MILVDSGSESTTAGKPRASGDDPQAEVAVYRNRG